MVYLLSILLGLIPEVLFIILFLSYSKNLKEKRLLLFLIISIGYILLMVIQQFKTIYYVLFIFMMYFSLKIVYKSKTQIIDLFVASIPFMWITIVAYICFLFLNKDLTNYYILYVIDRIVLFMPLIFKKNFHNVYKKYCKLWNRNDLEKRRIKSITLRNISLITINIIIFIMNAMVISVINFLS